MTFNIIIGGGRKLLREGLTLLLENQAELKVIGEADEITDVTKLVTALPVDAAILIESSTATIGIQQVASICRARNGLRVIVLALNPPVQWLHNVLRAGVYGCLTKDCTTGELIGALQSARDGRVYLSPKLVHAVVSAQVQTRSPANALQPLASREREVLRRIAEGQITKQIAAELGIGSKTVETYRRRIMKKLNAYTVADLTKHAIRQGLATLEVSA